jgi:hypothetical protein
MNLFKRFNKQEKPSFIPKNQHQLVLFYLMNYAKFDLKFVINDSMFIKFQTRLSDLENEYGTFTKKEWKPFVNRFGHSSRYLEYSLSNKELAETILKEIL